MWDIYIFRIGVCLEKSYYWIVLKNNNKGIPLTWAEIIPETYMNKERNNLERKIQMNILGEISTEC